MDTTDIIHDRLKGLFPELLGIRFVEATTGRVRAALVVRSDLCTVGGILHGGAIMAFADTLAAVATVLNLSPAGRTATIESKTNFLSAAPAGSTVSGECESLHLGQSTMVWQTKVTSETGKLIAVVIQTQLVLEA
jgi:1,4-dihydroxy-2-naphthoyl-CoA hydrolase